MSRYALIDCNNFFVSCERVFRPELLRRPVAVLSNNDGCIVARSNEVKALGVAMGVPLFQIRDIVKQHGVVLFSANFALYGDMSQRIVTILRQESPLIEVYSIDECFLDISQLEIASYGAWARRIRQRIWLEVGIPVSIGVAPTKTLAKVASTFAKKLDGVYDAVASEAREALLQELPVEDIWGIGGRLAPKLRDKGVSTAWQLTCAPDAWLRQQFTVTGMNTVDELRGEVKISFGDKREARASIMRSRSFGHTVRAYHHLESAVATFAARAAATLRAQDSLTRGVTVLLATRDKETGRARYISKTVSLVESSCDTARIITAALEALAVLYDESMAYRKAGVVLSDIIDRQSWQLSMLETEGKRDQRLTLMGSIDQLNRKYGQVVWHASERHSDTVWHSKNERRSPRYTTSWAELPVL